MTTGSTLYLVSACGTAEEFVAAFRRYADRTGLFVPSTMPLPAGRRGRLALTLKDGGVMIEGEAEILQSSTKATVLHGRPGMTIKFIDADELSKVVIGELEKARLAMKPAPPSVPARPSAIPADPRPVVPAVGGRIDAANALAECVVIGDPAQLVDTASAPKAVSDSGSGKAKFVVPSIPGVGSPRPNSPSTPPPMSGPGSGPIARPHTPSTPPPLASRPKTPSVPPDPTSKPLPSPAAKLPPSTRMTSVGFPIVDKLPAFPPKTNVPGAAPAENPLLQTQMGIGAPTTRATQMPAPPITDEATTIGEAPPTPPPKKTDPMPAAKAAVPVAEEATTVGEMPPTPPAASAAAPVAATSASKSGSMPAASKSGSMPMPGAAAKAQRQTSIGFPAMRTPFETQGLGTVRPPVVPGDSPAAKPGQPAPRGKNPTRPPLMPRHPTPVAPVPIVRAPAKAAPSQGADDAHVENAIIEEEKTDLSAVPQAPAAPAVDPLGITQTAPQRSGGMRASEILAAIPSEDWTMSPDASAPTVLPSGGPKPPPPVVDPEPTPGPAPAPKMPPKGPPTGNWSISLDPDVGWSEPVKLEKSPAPAPAPAPKKPKERKGTGTAGNPDITVASEQGFTAVEWEEKPTGIGEAKIEIDSTLMEPLKPMPTFDDDDAVPSPAASAGSSGRGIPPPLSAGVPSQLTPISGMPVVPGGPYTTPTGGMPVPRTYPTGPGGYPAYPNAASPFAASPGASPFAAPPASASAPGLFAGSHAQSQPVDPNAQFGAMGFPQADYSAAEPNAAAKRKRMIMIAAGAAVALIAGFVLVLTLAGGKHKSNAKAKAAPKQGSASEKVVVVAPVDAGAPPIVETGSGSGSAAVVAIDTTKVDAGTEVKEPVADAGPCKVSITSLPNGADIYQADKKLGTTPLELEMPCGVEAKITLRKSKFINTARSFTPAADKGNKVSVKLAKTTFTLKVTSTPAGATITVAGKSMGVTPGTIRLPAFEASPVMVSKPGYQTNSTMVTPKSNNISHHVTLKKGRR